MAKRTKTDAVLKELRAFGMRYPGVHYKSPWPGHKDLAVNDKTFAYVSLEGEPLSISCKLPISNEVAHMLPYTKPTAYGLSRSGWVTASFPDDVKPDVEMLKAWLDESYRAQAPKKLVKQLPPPLDSGELIAAKPRERRAAKKAAKKKAKPKRKVAKKKKPKKSSTR